MKGLVQTSSGEKALILVPSDCSVLGPELASRRAQHSLIWRMSLYTCIFLIYCFYHFKYLCNNSYGSPLWLAVGPRSSLFTIFKNGCPFDYAAFAVSGKVGIP